MRNYRIWKAIRKAIREERSCILIVVVDHMGSSPGKQGFKMMVTNSITVGSIGGGIMEMKMVDLARSMLSDGNSTPLLRIQDHNTKAPENQQSGLICSGTQTNVLMQLTHTHLPVVESILNCYGYPESGLFSLDEHGIEFEKGGTGTILFTSDPWKFQEMMGEPYTVYMFGAGHVGYAITRILSTLDFYIKLYDNRDFLTIFNENEYAHEKFIGSYPDLAGTVPSSDRSFVIIATFGMEYDAQVLDAVINKDLGFVGLMGSRTKIAKIFKQLKEKGVSQAKLDRVQAPIGIPINDSTAEEIAISICAQLIQFKNA
ncbi:MAG: XdhC family protein [Candidatus Heimdallarchaeota archaeon]|nr:XdhC family protein [Candidatus Heimdallarchaeota archaeon]